MTNHHDQIIAAAEGRLSEPVLAAVLAKPRGATVAVAGGGVFGGMSAKKQAESAAAAGLALGNPGAVALTATHLVTMQVKMSMTGQIKALDDVLSTVPLARIEELQVKRIGLGGIMQIRTGGSSFKLEGRLNDMKAFADAFARAKADASAS